MIKYRPDTAAKMKYLEIGEESLVPIRAREYYYDPDGRYSIKTHVIYQWCCENNITASRFQTGDQLDWWHVPNEEDRVLFVMRWS